MTSQAEVLNPEKVEVRITFTMPLGEWESIAKQMGTAYPAWKFTSAINDVARKVRQNVYYREPESE